MDYMMSIIQAASCFSALSAFYATSCIAEVRGLHDWLVKGAIWKTQHLYPTLTFDDGPDSVKTPQLLDTLKKYNAKAVFFIEGKKANKYPYIVRRILEDGHQLGNHSWDHPVLITKSKQFIKNELQQCQDIIFEITGTTCKFARPPYGLKDFRYYQILHELNLTPILWSYNLRDYWGSSSNKLLLKLEKSHAGEIILIHDGDTKAKHTISAVEQWLAKGNKTSLL